MTSSISLSCINAVLPPQFFILSMTSRNIAVSSSVHLPSLGSSPCSSIHSFPVFLAPLIWVVFLFLVCRCPLLPSCLPYGLAQPRHLHFSVHPFVPLRQEHLEQYFLLDELEQCSFPSLLFRPHWQKMLSFFIFEVIFVLHSIKMRYGIVVPTATCSEC